MRVLLTTDTVGGVWTFTRELTTQLLRQRHHVALVSFGPTPSKTQSAWCTSTSSAYPDRFTFHSCDAPLEWMQDNDKAWGSGAELLTQVAHAFQPDILHSSQFCWGALPLEVPKLITAHSDVLSWAAVCKPQGLATSPWLARYRALVQEGVDGADAIAAPTAWMRDALCEHVAVDAPFRVIPNGRAVGKRRGMQKRRLQAVSVGRLWDAGKGLATLDEIVSPMPVLVAGEQTFADEFGGRLPACVTLLGMLDESSLFDLFSASSIYLATSLYEPFGLAPLEAALCGCAVVARDLPSFREVWGEAAIYFQDGATLQSALAELAFDPLKLDHAQRASAERARSFSPDRMAGQYALLYRELLQGASANMSSLGEELISHAA